MIRRFVVNSETDREDDCSPAASLKAVSPAYAALAADIGEAVGLPAVAETVALEQLNPDDFVLWRGSWGCFVKRTQSWTPESLSLRVHRLGLLDDSRGDVMEQLEEIRPAFALPLEGRFGVKRGSPGGYIHGRKDIVSRLELKSSPINETEHYRIVYAGDALTLPMLIRVYLQKYWDVHGQ